jgi:hypothetical protein
VTARGEGFLRGAVRLRLMAIRLKGFQRNRGIGVRHDDEFLLAVEPLVVAWLVMSLEGYGPSRMQPQGLRAPRRV